MRTPAGDVVLVRELVGSVVPLMLGDGVAEVASEGWPLTIAGSSVAGVALGDPDCTVGAGVDVGDSVGNNGYNVGLPVGLPVGETVGCGVLAV